MLSRLTPRVVRYLIGVACLLTAAALPLHAQFGPAPISLQSTQFDSPYLKWTTAKAMELPSAQQWIGPNEYVSTATATTASQQVTFGFNATTIVVANDGAVTIYVTFASGTATTSKFPIFAGEKLNIVLPSPAKGLGLLAASSTASVRIGAWR